MVLTRVYKKGDCSECSKLEDLKKHINTIKKYSNIPICLDTEGAQIRTKYNGRKKFNFGNKIIIAKIKKKNFLNLYPDSVYDLLRPKDLLSVGFEEWK